MPTWFLAPIAELKLPTQEYRFPAWWNRFLGIDSWDPETFTVKGSVVWEGMSLLQEAYHRTGRVHDGDGEGMPAVLYTGIRSLAQK
jgi:hypothetical protein